MRKGDFVNAVKVGCGLLKTQLQSSRDNPQPEVYQLRPCYNHQKESLAHVQQDCPAVAGGKSINRLLASTVT
ncbi:hypothetical protein E2C01_047968 [Portunus trituberculatus]|uniref:Uncharacterized protein n=1 Tax=Portunus trituberculatus TaxID=210409 RepID=A0A5B7G2F6_PORTR|nr:hypothetical protein [Portunus trituberculatus]